MAMSGGVNSGTVYNMNRGRGYYPSRGGGRGGRGKSKDVGGVAWQLVGVGPRQVVKKKKAKRGLNM